MSLENCATFATLPKTERGQPMVINGDPKGKNFIYCNGTSVIIRNIEDPTDVDIYTQHAKPTSVARYSPSGFYIASGDITGKLRIWDTVNKEHILKYEYTPIAGKIKDIAWDADSKRICVVGEGRESFGRVFMWDTGSSTGEVYGQSKTLNQCAIKPTRPYRLATVSEDFSVAFFQGPPYKFVTSRNDHTNFANCVRYSSNGETFTTAGQDGRVFVYKGDDSELLRELTGPKGKAHEGGVYSICYNDAGNKIMTVSADKSARVWDIETGEMEKKFTLGTAIADMQVGCLWQGNHMLTVSLSGNINYLDPENPDTPKSVIKGHSKAIMALAKNEDCTKLYTAGYDGLICCWDVATGLAEYISGTGHTNQVTNMCIVESQLITIGMDDTIRHADINTLTYGDSLSLPSQPQGLDAAIGGLRIVACVNHVVLMRDMQIVFTENADWSPSCACIHPGHTEVAVGGKDDNKVHIYDVDGDTLVEKTKLDHHGSLTDVKYSPDGKWLATCDTSRNIHLFSLPDYTEVVSSQWTTHTARPNSLAWTPDSNHLASVGLDGRVCVFDPASKMNYFKHDAAHAPSINVTRVLWMSDNKLVTTGNDCNVKIWNVTHK